MLIFSPTPGSAFPLCLLSSQAPHGRQMAATGSRAQKSLKNLLSFSTHVPIPQPRTFGERQQSWTRFGSPALERGMASPSLEEHRQRRVERDPSEDNRGVVTRRMMEHGGTNTADAYAGLTEWIGKFSIFVFFCFITI